MKRSLFLILCCFLTLSLKAQSDAFWMSFGLGGVQAKKGLFRADFTVTYLRYNRWGGYLDLQANGRTIDSVKSRALISYSGYGAGVAYNFNAFGDQEQKLIARAGITYGGGVFVDSVKYIPAVGQSGQSTTILDWYKHNYKTIGLELSIEGLVVLNRPNQAWGLRLVTVLNRHPFIGGCIRYNIGAF